MVRMGGGFNAYFAFGSGRAFGGGAGRLGREFYGGFNGYFAFGSGRAFGDSSDRLGREFCGSFDW